MELLCQIQIIFYFLSFRYNPSILACFLAHNFKLIIASCCTLALLYPLYSLPGLYSDKLPLNIFMYIYVSIYNTGLILLEYRVLYTPPLYVLLQVVMLDPNFLASGL